MSRSWLRSSGVALFACAGATATLAQAIRYVDDDAPGGDGASWATAYTFLQDALADPDAIEIRVAGGTYRPDQGAGMTPGDRDATFLISAGVTLLGGFRGLAGGGDANDRDLLAFESLLSGDLADDDGANFTNYAENSLHVVKTDGSSGARTLDGLTIRGGNADGAGAAGDGGGLVHSAGALIVRNCRFDANHADQGGGLHVTNATTGLQLIDCAITGNHADTFGGGVYIRSTSVVLRGCEIRDNTSEIVAGGVYNRWGVSRLTDCMFDDNRALIGQAGAYYASNADPVFTRCDFTNNHAGAGQEANGGAVYHVEFSQGTYTACSFIGNTANTGGAIAALYTDSYPLLYDCYFETNSANSGGAIRTEVGTPTIDRCTFLANSAPYAGACRLGSGAALAITNSRFLGNVARSGRAGAIDTSGTLTAFGCLFSGNHAATDGGALHSFGDTGRTTLMNCTLVLNSADSEAGGVYVGHANHDTNIRGSILWANQDAGGSGEMGQVRAFSFFNVAVDYSCIQGWTGAIAGVGNTAADPLLRDATGLDGVGGTLDDDARLTGLSGSINAGDPAFDPNDPTFDADTLAGDLDGHSRVLCSRVDRGAYEFGIGDADCNRVVNFVDFIAWETCATSPNELMPGGGCAAFDFDADEDGDLHDFAGLQRVFEGSS